MDVRKERVLKEIEEKSQNLSLLWFMKNYEKVFKGPQLNPEQVPKNAAKLYEEIAQLRKRMVQYQKQEEAEEKLKRRPSQKQRELPEVSKEILERGPMYPVDPEIRKLIYTGVSHNDEGRKAYLKVRNSTRPDKKYYDSPTYGLEYGWDVEERCWRANKEFVRIHVVKKSFYRRTGALEVDDLRRRRPFSVAHKCVEIL
ncbi:protein SPMIP1 [Halyomorpha halys]|uniref:protein SPMIP1 n=1 Tax=Halyomorpha halys TaxID=286706 RepID=UPI0006D50F56|nr:uncharacterized protein LOC106678894 [Halyomorpha halys]